MWLTLELNLLKEEEEEEEEEAFSKKEIEVI